MTLTGTETPAREGQPLDAVADAFRKLTQGTLAERAYLALRSAILAGDIPPRSTLRETDVAGVIPISRTPIREALARLTAEGILTVGANRAAVVKDVDLQGCLHAYEILEVLEPLAVRLAAQNATEEQIVRLRESLELKAFFVQHKRWDDVIKEAQSYHEILYEASGNPRLADLIRRLREETHRFRRAFARTPKTADSAIDEDEAVVAMIIRRDGDGAHEVMRHHINLSTTGVRKLIEAGKTLEDLETE